MDGRIKGLPPVPVILAPQVRSAWAPLEEGIWHPVKENREDLARVIHQTLFDQPPWLEARFLYDERGSRLFDQICGLPEYYLTRTESALLEDCAEEILEAAPVECIVELGAGYARKTVHLLRAQLRQRGRGIYAPVDVSPTSLRASRDQVTRQFPSLLFQGLQGTYEEGMTSIDPQLPTLFAFLGSTVGNLTRVEFLRFFHTLSCCLGPRDYFLLGIDRTKEIPVVERAYDDSQGVTASFILNVLHNVNRITGSDFEVGRFVYRCRYNSRWQQVEMFAEVRQTHDVHFPGLGDRSRWVEGESIVVEISRKFEPLRLARQLSLFGLDLQAHFTDPRQWFSLLLFSRRGRQ